MLKKTPGNIPRVISFKLINCSLFLFCSFRGSIFSGVNEAKNVVIIIAGIIVLWSVGKLIRDFFMRTLKRHQDRQKDNENI